MPHSITSVTVTLSFTRVHDILFPYKIGMNFLIDVFAWSDFRSRKHNSMPEIRRTSLYSVMVVKMSRLSINRLFILPYHFTGCFIFAKPATQFSVLRHARHWERTTSMHPKLCTKLLTFFYYLSWNAVGLWCRVIKFNGWALRNSARKTKTQLLK